MVLKSIRRNMISALLVANLSGATISTSYTHQDHPLFAPKPISTNLNTYAPKVSVFQPKTYENLSFGFKTNGASLTIDSAITAAVSDMSLSASATTQDVFGTKQIAPLANLSYKFADNATLNVGYNKRFTAINTARNAPKYSVAAVYSF